MVIKAEWPLVDRERAGECLEALAYQPLGEWTSLKTDTINSCMTSVSAPLGLALHKEA